MAKNKNKLFFQGILGMLAEKVPPSWILGFFLPVVECQPGPAGWEPPPDLPRGAGGCHLFPSQHLFPAGEPSY